MFENKLYFTSFTANTATIWINKLFFFSKEKEVVKNTFSLIYIQLIWN